MREPLRVHHAVGAAAAGLKFSDGGAHKGVPDVDGAVTAGRQSAWAEVAHRKDGLSVAGVDPLRVAHMIAFAGVAERPESHRAVFAPGQEAVFIVEGRQRADTALVAGPGLQADLLQCEKVVLSPSQLMLPVGQPAASQVPRKRESNISSSVAAYSQIHFILPDSNSYHSFQFEELLYR